MIFPECGRYVVVLNTVQWVTANNDYDATDISNNTLDDVGTVTPVTKLSSHNERAIQEFDCVSMRPHPNVCQ